MASNEVVIRLTTDARFAMAWLRGCSLAAPVLARVVGVERFLRWGAGGARRLMRYRFDDGPWRWGL